MNGENILTSWGLVWGRAQTEEIALPNVSQAEAERLALGGWLRRGRLVLLDGRGAGRPGGRRHCQVLQLLHVVAGVEPVVDVALVAQAVQREYRDAGGHALERLRYLIRVVAALVVVVG